MLAGIRHGNLKNLRSYTKYQNFRVGWPGKVWAMVPDINLPFFSVSQRPISQSAQPTLKPAWHLPASRYHAFFFMEQVRNYGGIPGIIGDFLWFSFQWLSATLSLAFPSPRDRKIYDNSRRLRPNNRIGITEVYRHATRGHHIIVGVLIPGQLRQLLQESNSHSLTHTGMVKVQEVSSPVGHWIIFEECLFIYILPAYYQYIST